MTGREIMEKINYLGQEKALRKLAVKDNLADTEKIAYMTVEEICELISKKYECVWAEKEDLGLVKLEDMKAYNQIVTIISR